MDSAVDDSNQQVENKEPGSVKTHFQIFDEPDDELEEFDEIENIVNVDDPDIADWNEDWETAGWDDEDTESEFVQKILQELENYKKSQNPQ